MVQSFKCFEKIASWCLPDFFINQKLWSVSFETRHPNVHFGHWPIFEGYSEATVFENNIEFRSIINFQCTGCQLLKQLPHSILGISRSRFHQMIINLIFLKSTWKGLLESPKDRFPTPPKIWENQQYIKKLPLWCGP